MSYKHKEFIKRTEEAKGIVRSIMAMKEKSPEWEVQNILPDHIGGKDIISGIFKAFKKETNIPCSLPVFSFFAYASAYLLKHGINIHVPDTADLKPDIWIINLAESGSSKTWSKGVIEEVIPTDLNNEPKVKANFEQVVSGAAFLKELEAKNNGFYFQDEAAQMLQQIEQIGSPLNEVKKYLLMTYDHQKITRSYKEEEKNISIEKPALTMYWLNTIESFINKISNESIYDGFCQRFLYVFSEADLGRLHEDFPRYKRQQLTAQLKKLFERFFHIELHQTYTVSPEGVGVYDTAYRDFCATYFQGGSIINESFYRRVMFSSFKYGLIYHLALGKTSALIDAEDMKYAMQVCLLHLFSLKKLLTYKDSGYQREALLLEKIGNRLQELKAKAEAAGKALTIRDLQRSISCIKTKEQAKYYLDLLGIDLEKKAA